MSDSDSATRKQGQLTLADVISLDRDVAGGLFFSVACRRCDCPSPDTPAQAAGEGWRDIVCDEHGLGWNFLGVCPDCAPHWYGEAT